MMVAMLAVSMALLMAGLKALPKVDSTVASLVTLMVDSTEDWLVDERDVRLADAMVAMLAADLVGL